MKYLNWPMANAPYLKLPAWWRGKPMNLIRYATILANRDRSL